MKYFNKTLGLLLATLALASCGGSGSNGGVFAPPVNSTITLSATSTTLPVNTQGYLPSQYGNPTQATVTIDWHNPNGSLVNGQDIAVSISPPNIAALSCIIDGSACTDANQLYAQFTIKGTNGHATIFVNSYTTAGTATLTAVGVDPTTHANVSASMVFTITSGVGPAPASVTLTPSPPNVYLPGFGGSNTSSISATVLDGSGQLVPDPVSGNTGVDNIQFQIVGNAGDATLSTNSVAGPVSGTTVTTHTVHGVATASFQAGASTPQGPVQIKATVDRSDNNVTNGIADPVSFTTSVIVSDGKLFSLVITSPNIDSLQVNPPASADVTVMPDGTYSLTVSAQAVDRQGTAVATGTPIAFGLIDSPLTGFPDQGSGTFAIAGPDGNPQEGGTLFTAPSGQFTTAGGGAGAGDTLLVFGNLVAGNSDLESARSIAQVNSPSSLNVVRPFNPNDGGGTVDYGPVLPYVIGRASEASITASAPTNSLGVATAHMTYPVTRLGKAVYIWAQADGGTTATGATRLVSAISAYTFAGEAPAALAAYPSPIAGNTTSNVKVCFTDAGTEPLQGAFISFAFQGVAGQAILDGQSGSGTFAHPTGADGCVTGSITTSGIAAAGTATILFSSGSAVSITVPISPVGNGLLLQVSPSALPTAGGSVSILVTGSDGSPQASVGIGVACTGGVSSSIPSPTNASGQSSASITNAGAAGGTCVYTAGGSGGPTATVTVAAPAGGGGTPPVNDQVSLVVVRGPSSTAAIVVTSAPAGLTCQLAASALNNVCASTFPDGSTVLFSAASTPTGGATYTWTGNCTMVPGQPETSMITLSGPATCTLTTN